METPRAEECWVTGGWLSVVPVWWSPRGRFAAELRDELTGMSFGLAAIWAAELPEGGP